MEPYKPTEFQKMLGNELGIDPAFPDMHPMVHLSEVGEITTEDMKALLSTPPNPTLKFDHVSIDLTEDEIAQINNLRGERVESGRYEWTAGKALKDCKVGKP